jgi:hypothetical protein
LIEKTCADCGREFETTRDNAKYCRLCRLLKNLIYIGDRRYECWACGGEFAPLGRNDKFCGQCNTVGSVHDHGGECRLCGETSDQLLHADVLVCRGCSTNPDRRKVLIQAVYRKHKAVTA